MNRDAANLLRSLRRAAACVKRCQSKQDLQQILRRRSRERARRHREWLRLHEPLFLDCLARGENVNPLTIRPILEQVRTAEDKALFRYARFSSSLPFSDRVGRRVRFLVRDASVANSPIMGIAALGSPILDLGPRDTQIFDGQCPRRTKHQALRRIAELYVAVGLQPYSQLLAGKLICYCMASLDVVQIYNRKYAVGAPDRLVALYTIGAFGTTASQYNRLSFKGRLLYQNVGVTDGWSVGHIPDRLIEKIATFLDRRRITFDNRLRRKSASRLHLVHRFLRHVHVRPETVLYTGVHRGVYLCPLAGDLKRSMRAYRPAYDIPTLPEAISWWRWRWLQMRSGNDDVMSIVRAFRPEQVYSARAICG